MQDTIKQNLETILEIQNAIPALTAIQTELLDIKDEGGATANDLDRISELASSNTIAAIAAAVDAMAYRANLVTEKMMHENDAQEAGCCACSTMESKQSIEHCGGYDIYCGGELCFLNVSIGIVRMIAGSPWATREAISVADCFNGTYKKIENYR